MAAWCNGVPRHECRRLALVHGIRVCATSGVEQSKLERTRRAKQETEHTAWGVAGGKACPEGYPLG